MGYLGLISGKKRQQGLITSFLGTSTKKYEPKIKKNKKISESPGIKEEQKNAEICDAKESMDNVKMNHGQNEVKVKGYKRRLYKVHSKWFTKKDDTGNLYKDWLSLKDEYTVR